MSRQYKCYGSCNQKYEKEKLVNHNNKNYCNECYKETLKNQNDMKTLYNLIKTHYQITFPTSMHLAQIKQAKSKGYSYEDMVITMNYCINNLNMKFNPKMGFGWVTNKIEEAKAYFIEENERKSQVTDVYDENLFKVDKVKVTSIKIENTYKESKKVKWEDIL